ncbi:M20 metallopeptidase family protein [Actinophytocola xanthii]|uniref:Amidohydrolase n=1 Tax=Actinophytocola xanthii TaxID=1912961 RepID=A0A1Q8C4J1_9PSEU|nr:M20 family metallopeptidase [Actinophytocola xanthii]OLF09267.1 amidohydrolase [Actinophytocola xanthii]
MGTILDDTRAIQDDLVALRRMIHATPEVGLHLPRTRDTVVDALDGLPLELTFGSGLTSVTAVLRGGRPGPAVLLRADMDALPLTERTGLLFSSTVDGAMHACGHDLHTAMLVGAARVLAARREELAGDVVFMFQPGEEGCDGAALMVEEGVLTAPGRRVSAAFALHVFTAGLPHGTFTTRAGPVMASCDALDVTVRGTGGHGSAPHKAHDPIPAACEMVIALQTLVTRRMDVFDPVVLTTGQFHAGSRRNAIPDTARFETTVRAFSARARDRVRQAAAELVTAIGAGHGLSVELSTSDGYPVTVNDPGEAAFAGAVVADVLGAERFRPMPAPFAGAEDFSRVLAQVPGAFVILGACPADADPDGVADNHAETVVFDDAVLADGAAVYAELAARRLAG